MKAECAESSAGGSIIEQFGQDGNTVSEVRARAEKTEPASFKREPYSHRNQHPPNIPTKVMNTDLDDPIQFRAAPKSLPPQPQPSSQTEPQLQSYRSPRPGPVYMPLHRFNASIEDKKRKKK